MSVKYSVVVPCFNEQESVKPFYASVIPVMEQTKSSYEIIFVNDGSRDKTEQLLTEIASGDKRIKVINLSKNFGKQSAIFAGLKEASGEAVITINADLQDPVEIILDMIKKWKLGLDIVHGKYLPQKGESKARRRQAKRFSKLFEKTTGMTLPKNCTDFKLLDRKVVDAILSMPEKNRFLQGMTEWVGFSHTFVEYERQPKALQESKKKSKKYVEDATSDIISNSFYPLSFSIKTGIFFAVCSIICFITFAVLCGINISLPLVAWLFPTVALFSSIGFILSGLQNLYIDRIYREVQKRPPYVVRDKINFEGSNNQEAEAKQTSAKRKKKNSAQK